VVFRFPHALGCLFAATACTGPSTHVHNPDGHRVFVDGQALASERLPFRYYGTSRWDADPADTARGPDWSLQPASGRIDLPPPASPWLFPLDLPLELARRALFGREDVIVAVELPPAGADLAIEPEVPPAGLPELVDRAIAARIRR
jgi:hypothetical protein